MKSSPFYLFARALIHFWACAREARLEPQLGNGWRGDALRGETVLFETLRRGRHSSNGFRVSAFPSPVNTDLTRTLSLSRFLARSFPKQPEMMVMIGFHQQPKSSARRWQGVTGEASLKQAGRTVAFAVMVRATFTGAVAASEALLKVHWCPCPGCYW